MSSTLDRIGSLDHSGARAAARRRGQRVAEVVIAVALRVCAFMAVAGLLLIMVFVFREALPVLLDAETMKEASLGHYFKTDMWQPVGDIPKYGLLPLLVGTLKIVLVAMAFAVPVGVLAAVFASEFAPARIREALKPAIEILAGIPSVVLGFFALMVMASWIQALTHAPYRLNALNAGVALGLGVLPTIFTVCEDALRAVPRSFREASLALGATPWQTAWSVTLPAAGAGVSAGILLGLARAVGETMIVLMASGNAAIVSGSVFDSARTLSASIAAELAEVVFGSPHYSTLFFLGAILFVTTFTINVVAGFFVDRLRKRLAGG
ncbi:MAG: phosphate ABC transporter permease subunit PstC [Candidatus Eisenbacteria bacterium]|uniref:Phosphate transport system permease protein n=1 Tax=Eiseniibacteriota bacterium TaxID=2212470 RepID=A0A849SPH0_UNCEI|nr:phosphate ABC transporter permease subunit PstC [Candidatus Eisenbacteria bacterium]